MTLDYDAALGEALCFGWIDGQVRKRDAGRAAVGRAKADGRWDAAFVQMPARGEMLFPQKKKPAGPPVKEARS